MLALRFATRRAANSGGAIEVLALVPKPEFVAWGGVQATMEQEALEHAEELVAAALETVAEETRENLHPAIRVREGNPADEIRATLRENPNIAALVLGAAAQGHPGPLVAHFAGTESGTLPCPVMIVPGGLSDAALDRLC
ncbi:MAG: universal stress protein [Alphaproteobacteria bacterium]|nr:universal stress protein [Alphaproteobacteria bacterium]